MPLADHGPLDPPDHSRIPLVAQTCLVSDQHHNRYLTAAFHVEPGIGDPQHRWTVGIRRVDSWRGTTKRKHLEA